MIYKIEVAESLTRIVEVGADNEDEALDKVQEDYRSSEIVLDDTDFHDVRFNIIHAGCATCKKNGEATCAGQYPACYEG